MAEYIDKKALLDELCRDNCEREYDGTCHNCRMTDTIADFPVANVVEVVRCKDCTYYNAYQGCPVRMSGCFLDGKMLPRENDFCSYGERKEK